MHTMATMQEGQLSGPEETGPAALNRRPSLDQPAAKRARVAEQDTHVILHPPAEELPLTLGHPEPTTSTAIPSATDTSGAAVTGPQAAAPGQPVSLSAGVIPQLVPPLPLSSLGEVLRPHLTRPGPSTSLQVATEPAGIYVPPGVLSIPLLNKPKSAPQLPAGLTLEGNTAVGALPVADTLPGGGAAAVNSLASLLSQVIGSLPPPTPPAPAPTLAPLPLLTSTNPTDISAPDLSTNAPALSLPGGPATAADTVAAAAAQAPASDLLSLLLMLTSTTTPVNNLLPSNLSLSPLGLSTQRPAALASPWELAAAVADANSLWLPSPLGKGLLASVARGPGRGTQGGNGDEGDDDDDELVIRARGNNLMEDDGKVVFSDPVKLADGRIYVPLPFIHKNFHNHEFPVRGTAELVVDDALIRGSCPIKVARSQNKSRKGGLGNHWITGHQRLIKHLRDPRLKSLEVIDPSGPVLRITMTSLGNWEQGPVPISSPQPLPCLSIPPNTAPQAPSLSPSTAIDMMLAAASNTALSGQHTGQSNTLDKVLGIDLSMQLLQQCLGTAARASPTQTQAPMPLTALTEGQQPQQKSETWTAAEALDGPGNASVKGINGNASEQAGQFGVAIITAATDALLRNEAGNTDGVAEGVVAIEPVEAQAAAAVDASSRDDAPPINEQLQVPVPTADTGVVQDYAAQMAVAAASAAEAGAEPDNPLLDPATQLMLFPSAQTAVVQQQQPTGQQQQQQQQAALVAMQLAQLFQLAGNTLASGAAGHPVAAIANDGSANAGGGTTQLGLELPCVNAALMDTSSQQAGNLPRLYDGRIHVPLNIIQMHFDGIEFPTPVTATVFINNVCIGESLNARIVKYKKHKRPNHFNFWITGLQKALAPYSDVRQKRVTWDQNGLTVYLLAANA